MFEEGNVTMEDSFQNGRGKVPFDPNENFASMVNGWYNDFYPHA